MVTVRHTYEKPTTETYTHTHELVYVLCIASRLEGVQSIEELNDVYSHFLLYYANDLVTIHNKTKSHLSSRVSHKT